MNRHQHRRGGRLAACASAVALVLGAGPVAAATSGEANPRGCEASAWTHPGFTSPYLGHSGSFDGTGQTLDHSSRDSLLDMEVQEGLRWTLVPVWWSALEPNGPSDPDKGGPWASLDHAVVAAHDRHLNVLLQIDVGGNAGAPPSWAGQRTSGSSAPKDMGALVSFAGKLARRYRPCGALAARRHWTDSWGVQAWEMDNEPGSYETNWGAVADDYAEFVTKTAARLRTIDRHAVVVGDASGNGTSDEDFLREILDSGTNKASADYVKNGRRYAAGPSIEVASFHVYEQTVGLFNSAQSNEDFYRHIKAIYDHYERQPGFHYPRKKEYWLTEGGYDFSIGDPPAIGMLNLPVSTPPNVGLGYRANWTWQAAARAFDSGITKLCIQDTNLSPPQQVAVRTLIRSVDNPLRLRNVTQQLGVAASEASVFRTRSPRADTYMAWAANGSAGATVRLPVHAAQVRVIRTDGSETLVPSSNGVVQLSLDGGAPFTPPLIIVDAHA